MKRARKNPKKKKIIWTWICILLALAIIAVLGIGFYDSVFPGFEGQTEDFVEPVDKATGKVNVLLLGVDADGLRTDTIILATYDLDENEINMLSIPRDTRMYIGNKFQKINSAHAMTKNGKIVGAEGTIEAVTRLTGIPINYYIEFSCEAFRNTIDALGGVDFDVPQRMKYSDPAQDLYIDLEAGYQHLDGDKAEQFVRFRHYPRGDIARVEAQQAFMKALAEQKLNLGILANAADLYKVVQNDIKTNFTLKTAMQYVPNLKELSAENIHAYQLPGDFSGGEYSASYWIADIDQIRELVQTVFEYDAENIMTGISGKTDVGDKPKDSNKKSDSEKTQKTDTPKSVDKPQKADNVVKNQNSEMPEKNEIVEKKEDKESRPAEMQGIGLD